MNTLFKGKFLLILLAIFSITVISVYLYNIRNKKSDIHSTVKYSYNVLSDKESLLSNSKLIIRGNIIDSKLQNINIASKDYSPMIVEYKVVSVLVTDVVKGNSKIGDTIYVKYPNNDGAGISTTLDNSLKIDNDCLLFLNTYEEFDSNMPCSLISPLQSVITLNVYKDVDTTYDNSLDLFFDIPTENIMDYVKDNI